MADASRSDNPRSSLPSTQQSRQSSAVARRQPIRWGSPFESLFQRWNDEMDRMFDQFSSSPSGWRSPMQWSPQIEMFHRDNDLVVRADLPGLNKNDIHIDITDDVLTIHGERKQEHEEEREGWYRSERSYGSFHRAVALPEGAIADSAKASFKDGVLEIVLQAPPKEVSRGRRVDIK